MSRSDSTHLDDRDDRSDVEELLAKLEEMVSICSHLVDSITGEAAAFVEAPASDPFYSSSFD